MSTATFEPNRELPSSEFIRRQVRKRSFQVVLGSNESDVVGVSGCGVKRNARKKYKDGSSKTRIDDVETEEEADEYLKRLKRRHGEDKTTRLP